MQTRSATRSKPVMATKPMATKATKAARTDILTVREAANILMTMMTPQMQTRSSTGAFVQGRGCKDKQVRFTDEEELASMSDDDSSYAPSEFDDEGFADF